MSCRKKKNKILKRDILSFESTNLVLGANFITEAGQPRWIGCDENQIKHQQVCDLFCGFPYIYSQIPALV